MVEVSKAPTPTNLISPRYAPSDPTDDFVSDFASKQSDVYGTMDREPLRRARTDARAYDEKTSKNLSQMKVEVCNLLAAKAGSRSYKCARADRTNGILVRYSSQRDKVGRTYVQFHKGTAPLMHDVLVDDIA